MLKVLIVGPYTTNFSLAKVNRGFAQALAQRPELSVKLWKDPDFSIDKNFVDPAKAEILGFSHLLTDQVTDVDITIFNHFPDNEADAYGLAKLPGKAKLMYLAWEETVIPTARVAEINEHTHGVMAATSYTHDILRNNGVQVPVTVVPNALDNTFLNYQPKPYKVEKPDSFKFLHISSARQRKGVDVLLQAYFSEFSATDNVSLIIKSFPNRDNLVNDLLAKLRQEHKNPPHVQHIFDPDLSEQNLIDLTASCDCAVYPTRAEGFGLPIAEAMYLAKPTIATGFSGHMDFIDQRTGLILDYSLQPATQSEQLNLGARWAEPNQQDLQEKMRHVYSEQNSPTFKKLTTNAHERARQLSWENSAVAALGFLQTMSETYQLKQQTLAVVSPINTQSGIAEYSKQLFDKIESSFAHTYYLANQDTGELVQEDGEQVVRLWESGSNNLQQLQDWISKYAPEILHVQLHQGELNPQQLLAKCTEVKQTNPQLQLFLTPHVVKAPGIDLAAHKHQLQVFTRVLVHNQADVDYLVSAGIDNVQLFPHPYNLLEKHDQQLLRSKLQLSQRHPIIATHGLASHHKGLGETAKAVAELKQTYPDILWLALNAVNFDNSSSSDTYDQLLQLVKDFNIGDNVRLFPDYLESAQVKTLLAAADLGVLTYEDVGEAASGAIRKYFSVGLPTIVTDISTFAEFEEEVYKITEPSAGAISQAIAELYEQPKVRQKLQQKTQELVAQHSWEAASQQLLSIYAA